jgi:3-isopropylmalate dehydratase small subunit
MQLLWKAGIMGNGAKVTRDEIDTDEFVIHPDQYYVGIPDTDDASSFIQDGDYWEEV